MHKTIEKQRFLCYPVEYRYSPIPTKSHAFVGTSVGIVTDFDRIGVSLPTMPLSDLQIRKAKQQDKVFRLSDGWGLHLAVKRSGSKLWQLRYRYLGKEKTFSIGQYPVISLADARKKRDEAKRLIAEGKDPSVSVVI